MTDQGLNLRAHPRAIALANQQLTMMPVYDHYSQKYAAYVARRLGAILVLEMPSVRNAHGDKHAWYAPRSVCETIDRPWNEGIRHPKVYWSA